MKAKDALTTAANLVGGDRNAVHGDMQASFDKVALMWSAFLNTPVTAEQVAWCMSILKMVRATTGTPVDDHYIDGAGYAAIAGEVRNGK